MTKITKAQSDRRPEQEKTLEEKEIDTFDMTIDEYIKNLFKWMKRLPFEEQVKYAKMIKEMREELFY